MYGVFPLVRFAQSKPDMQNEPTDIYRYAKRTHGQNRICKTNPPTHRRSASVGGPCSCDACVASFSRICRDGIGRRRRRPYVAHATQRGGRGGDAGVAAAGVGGAIVTAQNEPKLLGEAITA